MLSRLARRLAPAVLLLLTSGGCEKEPIDLTCPAPTLSGWTPPSETVPLGEPMVFTGTMDWGGADLTGLDVQLIPAAGGTIAQSGRDVTLTFPTSKHGEVIPAATVHVVNRSGVVCATANFERIVGHVAGGAARDVVFPVDEVSLVVGERRVMQATPLLPRPAANISGALNDLTVSHQPVTYASSAPAVVEVTAEGVLVARSVGQAEITATANGHASAPLTVVVRPGAPTAAPEGAHHLTSRLVLGSYSDSSRDDRSLHTAAIGPDGNPVALAWADVGLLQGVQHITSQNPLHLLRWSGSGLGHERVSGWDESHTDRFVTVSNDGHVWVGFMSNLHGFTVLDRPGDVEQGGWRRRELRTSGETGERIPRDATRLTVVLPTDDGAWVAFAVGKTLWLARLSPGGLSLQEVEVTTYNASAPWAWLTIGPPTQGAALPHLVGLERAGSGYYAWSFLHDGSRWVQRNLLPGQEVVAAAFEWSPGAPAPEAPRLWGRTPTEDSLQLMVGLAEPGGATWSCGPNSDGCQRFSPYREPTAPHSVRPDSLLAPHFPAAFALDPGAGSLGRSFESITGGWGRGAVMTSRTQPDAGAGLWLYLTDLPQGARHDADDLSGHRLGSQAYSARYAQAFVMPDGARALLTGSKTGGAFFSRATSPGAGQPFTQDALPVPHPGSGLRWLDGARLLDGVADLTSITLSQSTDGAQTFSVIGAVTPGFTVNDVIAAISVGGGVHWLVVQSNQVARLLRVVEGSPFTVTEVDLARPGLVLMPEEPFYGFARDGTDALLVISSPRNDTSGTYELVTRRLGADGTVKSTAAVVAVGAPLPGKLARTSSGAMLVPTTAGLSANELADVVRSDDDGQTWISVGAPFSFPAGARAVGNARTFPPLVTRPTGDVAMLVPWRVTPDRTAAALFVTADGTAWRGPVLVRPGGGRAQAPWALAAGPDDSLLVHLGDSGTAADDLAVRFFSFGPFSPSAFTNAGPYDAVVSRVPASRIAGAVSWPPPP